MAYFIFLNYLDSLEDFRKNPHVKIPPKSPCANFQSLGIFKNSIFNQKIFFSTFGPIGPAASRPIQPFGPHGPVGRLLPPPTLEQSAQVTTIGRPRAAPMVGPTTTIGGKIIAASLLLHFPIKRRPSHSSIPGNRRLQSGGALKLLQHRPLKAAGHTHIASAL
jgi:hypothetical protein